MQTFFKGGAGPALPGPQLNIVNYNTAGAARTQYGAFAQDLSQRGPNA